jgi:hypothetical protein
MDVLRESDTVRAVLREATMSSRRAVEEKETSKTGESRETDAGHAQSGLPEREGEGEERVGEEQQ